MTLVALLDSCVLYPGPLCDTLLRAAGAYLYRPHFTHKILDNAISHRNLRAETAQEFKELVLDAFPDALRDVDARFEKNMPNHPSDRHVLAAAVIPPHCEVIVTFNLEHFNSKALKPFEDVYAIHPDNFLYNLCDEHSDDALLSVIKQQSKDLGHPKTPPIYLLDKLYKRGVKKFSSRMTNHAFQADIVRIARKILREIGEKNSNNEKIFSGESYLLKSSRGKLNIREKKKKRVLIDYVPNKRKVNLIPLDVIKFINFEEELDKLLRERKSA